MKVKFTRHLNSLSIGNVYWVIGIERNSYRILSDVGEPYLYPPENFEVIEKGGEGWNTNFVDGDKYSYPTEFAEYFFEDYFETYDPKKRAAIRHYLEKLIREEESSLGKKGC